MNGALAAASCASMPADTSARPCGGPGDRSWMLSVGPLSWDMPVIERDSSGLPGRAAGPGSPVCPAGTVCSSCSAPVLRHPDRSSLRARPERVRNRNHLGRELIGRVDAQPGRGDRAAIVGRVRDLQLCGRGGPVREPDRTQLRVIPACRAAELLAAQVDREDPGVAPQRARMPGQVGEVEVVVVATGVAAAQLRAEPDDEAGCRAARRSGRGCRRGGCGGQRGHRDQRRGAGYGSRADQRFGELKEDAWCPPFLVGLGPVHLL